MSYVVIMSHSVTASFLVSSRLPWWKSENGSVTPVLTSEVGGSSGAAAWTESGTGFSVMIGGSLARYPAFSVLATGCF